MTTVAARYCRKSSSLSGAFIRNRRSFHHPAATLGSGVLLQKERERAVGDSKYIKLHVHTASQTGLEEEKERLVGDKRTESQAHTASFGFREVPEEEKERLVGDVFKSVASNYDLMNDIMSAGLHRLWKDRLVSKLSPFPGMQHLDVAGGTGDVAFRVLEAIHSRERMGIPAQSSDVEAKDDTRVFVCDINPAMLNVGKKRAQERGLGGAQSLVWVEGDAEALSFQDNSMDGYTIAFGIRNVTHIDKALKEAYRVLKHGGHFLCLELSHVENPIFKQMYDFYSFSIIPRIGSLVAGDRASYQYLVESIRRFPSQEKFAAMIQEAGFENAEYENLVGGVVAIHSGYKL